MSFKRLGILLLLAVVVGGGALWLHRPRTVAHDPALGRSVLPGLAQHLDTVTTIKLIGAGKQVLLTLERTDGGWRVAEARYPADASKVRRLLVALGDLKVLEAKTSDPARFATLGLEDPAAAGAQSIEVDLAGPTPPVALIVGHSAGTGSGYVRVAGSEQAYEARPSLDVPRALHDWLTRGFLDLAAARIASVDVERADGPAWRAEREDRKAEHFAVPKLPHGAELTNLAAPDASGSAFGNLEFDDVRAAVATAPGEKRHRVVVRTYDGLVVTLTAPAAGAEHWLDVEAKFDAALAAHFAAGAEPHAPSAEDVRKEAERIDALAAGHDYKIPAYRFDGIFRPRSELLRH